MNEVSNFTNQGDKKKIMMVVGVLALALIIVIVLILSFKKDKGPEVVSPVSQTPSGEEVEAPIGEPIDSSDMIEGEELGAEVSEIQALINSARVEAPGAALITEDNRVINESGLELKSDADRNTMEAPAQTLPVNEADLAESVIKIEALPEGFSPSEFSVKAGAPITMSLIGKSGSSHVLIFEDPALKAIMIAIRADETRAITFKAPTTKGEYRFYCDFPGHASTYNGKMIVE